jgi:flagellar hook protein FlgE
MGTTLFSRVAILSWVVTLGCGGKTYLLSEAQPADVTAAGGAWDGGLVDAQPAAPAAAPEPEAVPEAVSEPQAIPEGDGGAAGAPADSPPRVGVPPHCSGRATSVVRVTANLDADSKAINTAAIVGPPSVAASPWNPLKPANTANFSTTITIYDSLGVGHSMDIYFRKSDTEARTWDYHLLLPGPDVVGGVAGGNFDVGGGTLRFASNGALSSDSGSPVTIAFGNTSVSQIITIDLAGRFGAGGTAGGMTNVAGPSNVMGQFQDGVAASCNVSAY